MNSRACAHPGGANRIPEPYIRERDGEKVRTDARAHLFTEQVPPSSELPGPMFEAFEQGNANARAWIARNPEAASEAIPPPPASSTSEASRRGVDGARAALVGWYGGGSR